MPPPLPKENKIIPQNPIYTTFRITACIYFFLNIHWSLLRAIKNTRKMLGSLLIRLCDYVTIMMIK